jgi:hypothetical protein
MAALAVSFAFDDQHCTPADPSVCGPDPAFTWALVALVATPVLLWWRPALGCLAGVVYTVLDLAFDPIPEARLAFGLHGLACLVVLALLLGDRRRGRIGPGLLPTAARPPAPPLDEVRLPSRFGLRTGAGAVLTLCALPLFAYYLSQEADEHRHLQRARVVTATVLRPVDDGYAVELRLPGGREVRVDTIESYPRGRSMPVRVDPADPTWVRLVSEPADDTGWASAGLGALLLAGLLLERDLAAHRARRRLRSQTRATAVAVSWDGGALRVFPPGAEPPDEPVAVFSVVGPQAPPGQDEGEDEADQDWRDVSAEAFGQAWRRDEAPTGGTGPLVREPAVAVGHLHHGGWAAVVAGPLTFWPRTPLAPSRDGVVRRFRSLTGSGDREPDLTWDDDGLPGRTVPAAPTIPADLPWLLTGSRRTRALAALSLVAGGLGGPTAGHLFGFSRIGIGLVTAATFVVLRGWTDLTHRVRIAHPGVRIVATLQQYDVPWEHVLGARVDDEAVWIAWAPDEVIDVGPFPGPPPERVAAVIDALRDRALAVGVAGRAPGRRTRFETLALMAGYAALLGSALWLR